MKALKKRVALHSPSATPKCNPPRKKGCRLHLGCTSFQTKCNPLKPHDNNVSPLLGCTLQMGHHIRTHEKTGCLPVDNPQNTRIGVRPRNEVQPATQSLPHTLEGGDI